MALSFPFRLEPAFYTRIWGYRDLHPWYDYTAKEEPVGEVWLTGEGCLAATGPLQGKSLKEITSGFSAELLGKHAEDSFPLLIKTIFPREKLSVQVHPDDAMAQKYGQPRGKTECWYALDAEPGAQVALGLKPGTTDSAIRAAIADNTLESLLEYVPMKRGDMVFVDAGTVHAIAPGTILLETQQTSDITYRLYDYGRPRELHVDRSLEALRVETKAGKIPPINLGDRTVLIDVDYFRVEQVPVSGTKTAAQIAGSSPETVQILFAAAGSGVITGGKGEQVELPSSSVVIAPAAATDWTLQNTGGLDLIRIVPQYRAGA